MKKWEFEMYRDIECSEVRYFNRNQVELKIILIQPKNEDFEKSLHPAIIFYFGGGFAKGNPDHFRMQAEYFAHLGAVCFLPEYQVISNTSGLDTCFNDARDGFIHIIEHHDIYHLDKKRIIVCGGSAGGTLAASISLLKHLDTCHESLLPCAMILFNPVLFLKFQVLPPDLEVNINGEQTKMAGMVNLLNQEIERLDAKLYSPGYYLENPLPKCLILSGNQDEIADIATLKNLVNTYQKLQPCCRLIEYDGMRHGFFNWSNFQFDQDCFHDTLFEMERFLREQKLLDQHISKNIID